MVSLVWYDSFGMVWFHGYGMIPLVWYAFIYNVIPFLWYDSIGMILNTYGIRKFWQSGRLVDPVQKSISMYVMEESG